MPKILVADDNTNIQKMVTLAFQERGIEVVAVGNGEAAVRRLPDMKPDIVLADIFMPVRNGYEVCEYIKKDDRFAQIPVILLLGAFDPLDEKEARRVGADGILKKPFVPPDPLIAMVIAVLEKNPAIAAELQKKKKSPVAESAGPKPAASGPLKPLSRLSQMSAEVTELVPEAALASNEKSVEMPAPPSAEEEIDATPQWRRSAMKFEISPDAASQSIFMEDELPAETSGLEPTSGETRTPVANPIANAAAPFEPGVALKGEEGSEEDFLSLSGSTRGSEKSEPSDIPLAANEFEIAADPEPPFEMIEAPIVPDVRPEEQPIFQVPVVAAEPWQPPVSVETEVDLANPTSPAEPQHEETPFYDPPPRRVPVAEIAQEDDLTTVSASTSQENDPEVQPPSQATEPIHEDLATTPMAPSSQEPAVPEPAFSSRARGWMESIAPSGTPAGGWLASVADVLAETDQAEPRATSAKASAMVAEPPAAETSASLEASLANPAKSSFLPELDEPFFLDEALTESASEASAAPPSQVSLPDDSPAGWAHEPEAASISTDEPPIPEMTAATPEKTAGADVHESEIVVDAPQLANVEQEQTADADREAHVDEYGEPEFLDLVSRSVKTDPLLVLQEDEVLRQPSSAYGSSEQQIPPPYAFLTDAPLPKAEEASSETAATAEPELALSGTSKNEISSAEHAATEVAPDQAREIDVRSASVQNANWEVSAQEISQYPAEPPLQEAPVVADAEAAMASISPLQSEENSWIPTQEPPNLEALREIPFLTPSREFLTGNAEKSWNAPVIARQAHGTPTDTPEEHGDHSSLTAHKDEESSIERESANDHSTEVETLPQQDSAPADSAPVSATANEIAVDEVVRKVIERLEPKLHELLAQGLLKPLVESILHEQSEHK